MIFGFHIIIKRYVLKIVILAAQIKSSIITKIKTQEYLPGELLPSERDFATMYSVSRYLIHDIFDELISQH